LGVCGGKDQAASSTPENDAIDESIRKDRSEKQNEIKIFLTGAGESGKSTVAKQMKIIHDSGFSDAERKSYITIIHSNIIGAIKAIITAGHDLGVAFSDPSLATPFATLPDKVTPDLAAVIQQMWADDGVKEILSRRHQYQLADSIDYYVGEIDRIAESNYVPTPDDILRSRAQTTGIIESEFKVNGYKLLLVDVGGQRSERKKWMLCFQDVSAILFVVALSGFNLSLHEDRRTNRILEALRLFHQVCISQWFTKAAMILFLNKADLFSQKLEDGASIKAAFPEYKGEDNYDDSLAYIQDKFMDVRDPRSPNKPKEIYPHVTTATDTDGIKHVFDSVLDFVMHQAINSAGL